MKPETVLSELEREPIVFFGCTWTEIISAMRGSVVFGLVVAGFAATAFVYMGVPGGLVLGLGMFVFMGSGFFFARRRLYSIAELRVGKPLYYEKHAGEHRSEAYIQPRRAYGRERLLEGRDDKSK